MMQWWLPCNTPCCTFATALPQVYCTCSLAAALPQACRTCATTLPQAWRKIAAPLPHMCRSLAAALPRACRSLAARLLQPVPQPCRKIAATLPRVCRSLAASLPQDCRSRSLATALPQPCRALAAALPQGLPRLVKWRLLQVTAPSALRGLGWHATAAAPLSLHRGNAIATALHQLSICWMQMVTKLCYTQKQDGCSFIGLPRRPLKAGNWPAVSLNSDCGENGAKNIQTTERPFTKRQA